MTHSARLKTHTTKTKSSAAKENGRKQSERSTKEAGHRGGSSSGSVERTRRLLLAALRVWELKRRRLE